uniref:Uncharacterized protein n=1 Tax=Anopheles farauti TaxID=69004 RepID=A0A182QTR2_9DIPT
MTVAPGAIRVAITGTKPSGPLAKRKVRVVPVLMRLSLRMHGNRHLPVPPVTWTNRIIYPSTIVYRATTTTTLDRWRNNGAIKFNLDRTGRYGLIASSTRATVRRRTTHPTMVITLLPMIPMLPVAGACAVIGTLASTLGLMSVALVGGGGPPVPSPVDVDVPPYSEPNLGVSLHRLSFSRLLTNAAFVSTPLIVLLKMPPPFASGSDGFESLSSGCDNSEQESLKLKSEDESSILSNVLARSNDELNSWSEGEPPGPERNDDDDEVGGGGSAVRRIFCSRKSVPSSWRTCSAPFGLGRFTA